MTPDENKVLCDGCDECCKHIALEIDEPEDYEDYENIMWYLLHENVSVYIDEDDWFIEFKTKCKALGEDKMCKVYDERPSVCRGYSQEDCVKYGEGEGEDRVFNSREDLLNYMKEKGITKDS